MSGNLFQIRHRTMHVRTARRTVAAAAVLVALAAAGMGCEGQSEHRERSVPAALR